MEKIEEDMPIVLLQVFILKKIKYKLNIKKMEVLTKIAKTINSNKTLYKMLLNLWNMMKMMIGRKC